VPARWSEFRGEGKGRLDKKKKKKGHGTSLARTKKEKKNKLARKKKKKGKEGVYSLGEKGNPSLQRGKPLSKGGEKQMRWEGRHDAYCPELAFLTGGEKKKQLRRNAAPENPNGLERRKREEAMRHGKGVERRGRPITGGGSLGPVKKKGHGLLNGKRKNNLQRELP